MFSGCVGLARSGSKLNKTDSVLAWLGIAGLGLGFVILSQKKPVSVSGDNSAGYGHMASRRGDSIMDQLEEHTMKFLNEPRGIRNNNPLNLRWYSVNAWVGLQGQDEDGYCVFDTPENGIRAAAKVLNSYAARGVVTISDIVRTWAPAADNNPEEAYVNYVASAMNKTPDYQVGRGDYVALLSAMIYFENGKQPYPVSVIADGVSRA